MIVLKGPSARKTTMKMISALMDGQGCPCIGVANLPGIMTTYSAKGGALRFLEVKGSRNVKARQSRRYYTMLTKTDSCP